MYIDVGDETVHHFGVLTLTVRSGASKVPNTMSPAPLVSRRRPLCWVLLQVQVVFKSEAVKSIIASGFKP